MTLHVFGPRRDTQISEHDNFSVVSRRNSGFKRGSVIVNNIFAYFTLSLIEYLPGFHGQRMVLVLPNQLL